MTDPGRPVKTPPPRHRPEPLGQTVGRFRIDALLGSGGMGEVYRAFDTKLQRPVAIKRMFGRDSDPAADRSFFLREGQRASALIHPNIAAIYDVIEEKDDVLLVMEFVAGTTLRDQLGASMPLDRFFAIAFQCVDALSAAHAKGILHGDIKPENIMLTPSGQVKLLDFGVARRIAGTDPALAVATTETLSQRRALGGTPVYMAPEVLRGESPDARADIFALGIVFYEMLAGTHPFRGPTTTVTTAQILHEREAPVLDRTSKIPAGLASVVARALSKDPTRRYADTNELRRDLETVRHGGRPAHGHYRSTSPSFLPWIASAAALALLALALLPASRSRIGGWWRHLRHPAPAGMAAPRLAVLPPRVDGTSPDLAAFADGLSATVAARLSTLSQNHDLQIINSTHVERAQASAPGQAMNALGANLALQIEVQQAQQMNRVVWTLTSVQSGQVLASQTLTAPIADPFSLQDQVSDGVIQALRITLRPEEQTALGLHGTVNPAAYDFYLQGVGNLEHSSRPGAVPNALDLLNHAIALDPNFGMAWAERGTAWWLDYKSTKETTLAAKARDNCNQAVALGNAGADGHICLGLIGAGTGQYDQAAQEYQKAIQLDPGSERAWVGLADAYTRLNRISDAENTWRRAIAANPNSTFVLQQLAIFYLQQAQYAKAAGLFEKVLSLAPESFIDYSNLGAADLYLGNYPAAIAAFQQSLRLRPAPGAYSNLGTAYYQARNFTQAARYYELALRYNTRDPDLWGNLADAYHFSNQQPKAMDAWRRQLPLLAGELQINPRDAQLQGEIASCYAGLGNQPEADAHLALSLEYGRDDKDLLFNAAVVYNDLGETGDALEWLHKSLLAGYSATIVRDSPEFDNLRGNPQFQQLLSRALVK